MSLSRSRFSVIPVLLVLIVLKSAMDLYLAGSLTVESSLPFIPSGRHGQQNPNTVPVGIPRSLRTMNSTGGVVFFYHMQKTGGITVRIAAKRQGKQRVKFIRPKPFLENFLLISEKIQWYLRNTTIPAPRPVLFVEHHGGGQSIFDMEPHFKLWREASRSTGIPLFIFTLLRDPVSLAISHFNFFHVPPGTPPFDHPLYEATEENLRLISKPEHQLRMLAHGGEGNRSLHVDFDDALEVRTLDVLHKYFSWVGATEQLSQVTLPLLGWIMLGDTGALTNFKAKNVGAKRRGVAQLEKDNMTSETLSYLESINQRTSRIWQQEAWYTPTQKLDSRIQLFH